MRVRSCSFVGGVEARAVTRGGGGARVDREQGERPRRCARATVGRCARGDAMDGVDGAVRV